ncbi:MAG: VWA domain-containing protein [Oscillospiraceae bacterium]|nr:VWA domain-containing protein [Oscillospiraceae bacterium]
MKIERGFRGKLSDHFDPKLPVRIRMTTAGGAVYDTCCFGLDSGEKLSDDRYMIFYNQPASPANEITYKAQGGAFDYLVDVARLPESVAKLVFTVSIDGDGTMGQISSHSIQIYQGDALVLESVFNGSDFQNERAIIGLEIYRKNEWRISVVARGFDGGLVELLKKYGGELADENASERPAAAASAQRTAPAATPAPTAAPAPQAAPASAADSSKQISDRIMGKINLSKDKVNLEKHVVNLSKCVVDLSKKSGVDLGNIRAKVVVALDYSGSMGSLYRNGTVQSTLKRLVPLGLTFDDNGSIDIFLFQNDFRQMEELTLSNYENYVASVINCSGYTMGGTAYAPVLSAIIEGYSVGKGLFGRSAVPPIVDNGDPTFILFITDGENADKLASDSIIRRSSGKNVFIQFIGIGNESFKYLKKLDDLPGRVRDNTGFTKMSDLSEADDRVLYTNVLEQFSNWLKGLQ